MDMQRIMGQIVWGSMILVGMCLAGLIAITITHDGETTQTVVTALVAIASSAVPSIIAAVIHYMLTSSQAGATTSSSSTTTTTDSTPAPVATPTPIAPAGGA